jgi:putative addiction module component (TIGR02574 family)
MHPPAKRPREIAAAEVNYLLGNARGLKVCRSLLGLVVGAVLIMNSDQTSVFDLSPSEKLQLVEDLWDDLAATPEAVPVHDWQKDELVRRKANLLRNPASALSWQEIQRRVRSRYGR